MNLWNKIVKWFGYDDKYLTSVYIDICPDFVEEKYMPRYSHDGDGGMDVFAYEFVGYYNNTNQEVVIDEAIEEFVLHPRQRLVINTGISADIPKKMGIFGLIRSGLSTKHGLSLINGVGLIDHIYKGKFCFVIVNLSDVSYTFKRGDKIGQAVLFYQIKGLPRIVNKLKSSVRGANGFGSSGK